MLATDARFRETIEAAVRRIESATSAEVVVVAAPRSGSYRDLALAFAAAITWLVLMFLVHSPYLFSSFWIPLELAVVFGGVAWLAHRAPWLMRRLAGTRRCARQVDTAAHAVFHEESVDGTRGRTGLLVYLSLLEERVALIPDAGIEALVAPGIFHAIRWGHRADPAALGTLDEVVAAIEAVGRALASGLPATGENPNEISDAPRILR